MSALTIMPEADAVKATGKHNQKFGSATKNVVCGDKLCSDVKRDGEANQQSRFQVGGVAQQAAPVKSGSTGTANSIKFDKNSYVQTDQFYVEVSCKAANTSNNNIDSIMVTVNAFGGPLSGNSAVLTASETDKRSGVFKTSISSAYTLTNRVSDPQTMTATATCGGSQLTATNVTVLALPSITFGKSQYLTSEKPNVNIFCPGATTMIVTLSGPLSFRDIVMVQGAMSGTFYTNTFDPIDSMYPTYPTAGNLAGAGQQITASAVCGSTTLSAIANIDVSSTTVTPSTETSPITPSTETSPITLLTVPDRSILEGTSSQNSIIIIPVLIYGTIPSGGIALTITVTDQTAVSNGQTADYSNQQSSVTIMSGSSYDIPITIIDDSTYEQNETFSVTISTSTANVSVTKPSAQVTIINDDADPSAPVTTTSDRIFFSKSNYAATESASVNVACTAASTMEVVISGPKQAQLQGTLPGAMPGTFYTSQFSVSNFAGAGQQITATATCGGSQLTATITVLA